MQVRRAHISDAKAVLDALEDSLADDPFARWLTRPGPVAFRTYLELMLVDIALPRGIAYLAEEGGAVLGAALWAPPGSFELGLGSALRLLPKIARVVGWRRIVRVSEVLRDVEEDRPPEPRWLLTLLGTVPEQRGRGVASALMAPALARCDQDGEIAALETAHRANLDFYQRFGFEEVAARQLGADGPHSWTLVRPPRPG